MKGAGLRNEEGLGDKESGINRRGSLLRELTPNHLTFSEELLSTSESGQKDIKDVLRKVLQKPNIISGDTRI
ncbi:Hypothetical predicted protein [Octopus vulgaris]|uniref:Uncharacterized protein n=1 Tax=Octopus vulgaris TaxID=6645 RepID=A0AA36BCL3_OCTVU|nr:Hypothetical predicted protein [Octopus vulgaris]